MGKDNITRKNVIDALIDGLKPLEYVYAMWEAGAASFRRVDGWSDIDLYVVCEDERVEDTFRAMEKTLLSLSEFDLKFRLPEPTWHGHSQVFWRLKKTSPYLFLDIVVMKKSSKDKFLQYKIHGKPLIHFDKTDIITDDTIDPDAFFEKLSKRLETLKTNFELFKVMPLKELNRGNYIEALTFYMAYAYRPLIEALRIKHCPYHHNFHNTYLYYDLPPTVVKRLHKLNFIANSEELCKCITETETWFWEVINDIDFKKLRRILSSRK